MKPVWLALGIVLVARSAAAQVAIEECGTYRDSIQMIVDRRDAQGAPVGEERAQLEALRLAAIQNNANCFALFMAGSPRLDALAFGQFVRRFEGSRTDKETSAASGGTSVVSQGPAARVLSAAVDFGALTRGVDGQVVTIRGNLAGLPSALVRKDVFPYCPAGVEVSEFCVEHSLLSWLRRASFSMSFDANRGTQAAGAPATTGSGGAGQEVRFVARGNQVSAASGRLELWNRRDVTTKQFQDLWRTKVGAAMSTAARDLSRAAGGFVESVINLPDYDSWQKETGAALQKARTREEIVKVLRSRLERLRARVEKSLQNIRDLAAEALSAYRRFFLAQDDLVDSLATKSVLALEYQYGSPQGKPATHHYRVIFDRPLTTRTKIVANGAWTLYGDLPEGSPAGMSKYRDAQAGVQVEHGLRSQAIIGPAALVAALYYQYQHAPSLLKVDPARPLPGIAFTELPATAKTVFTKTGDIWLGQLKLVLNPTSSSIKIPLAVTLANRTELIDKATWKAQLGVSYDVDALLGVVGDLPAVSALLK